MKTRFIPLALAGALTLVMPAFASAHASVSPAVSVVKKLQLYSLAVPTEKDKLTTTKVVLTLPSGFSIDSFVRSPGWQRVEEQSGSGNNAVITKVTWTGGKVPTGEDSLFQFLALPASSKSYSFKVEQTYSDGSIVNWSGPESSYAPAPTIDVKDSLGGGGTSFVAILAVILAALALGAGAVALAGGGGNRRRPLA